MPKMPSNNSSLHASITLYMSALLQELHVNITKQYQLQSYEQHTLSSCLEMNPLSPSRSASDPRKMENGSYLRQMSIKAGGWKRLGENIHKLRLSRNM